MPDFKDMDRDQLITLLTDERQEIRKLESLNKKLTEASENFLKANNELKDQLRTAEAANVRLNDHNIDLGARLQVAEAAATLPANLDRIGFIRVVRDLMGFDLRGAKEFADSFKIEPGQCATQEQRDRRNNLLEARVQELKEWETIAKGVGQTEQSFLLQIEEMGRQRMALEETIRGAKHNIQSLETDLMYSRQDVERAAGRLNDAEDRITTLQEENADLDRKNRTLEDQVENEKANLQENLKNVLKMLFADQKSNAVSLLLDMLTPKNPSNEPPEDDGIPF